METALATLFEAVAEAVPQNLATVCGEERQGWAAYEDRSRRLAAGLGRLGLGRDSKIGLYLHNSSEYLEAHYAAFKLRAVPVNVNYRYVEDELVYLLDNADAEGLVFDARYADRVGAIRARLPRLKAWVAVRGPSASGPLAPDVLSPDVLSYESLIAESAPLAPILREPGDPYMIYTGGTTGTPKGVVYEQRAFTTFWLAALFGAQGLAPPASLPALQATVRGIAAAGRAPVVFVASPLMHGVGIWTAMMMQMLGGAIVTDPSPRFDAHAVWRAVVRERATMLVMVGDAFGKPLLAALEEAAGQGSPYDLSALQQINSSGVMWSAPVKEGLLKYGNFQLFDSMGSSEGVMARQITMRGAPPQTAKFELNPHVKVFTDDGREVLPGSPDIGRIATTGAIPVAYYKDPKKSAETFKTINGVRYSLPGDYARVEADGTITLLGRGSVCINTGGEKVFPEEVEEVVKLHPAVEDCLVVGVPDARFGERVAVVLALRPGMALDDDALLDFGRTRLAGYKLPRLVVPVARIERGPNGKADYKWAREAARQAAES